MANEEQLRILEQGIAVWNTWRFKHQGVMLDLAGADLAGANLSQANLAGADLRTANLRLANLRLANLPHANLYRANLHRANLTGAILTGATLTGTTPFSDANLIAVNLADADLSGANLTDANLTDANFTDADLTGADLTGANLDGAIFHKTNLKNADFSGTLIRGTTFADLDLSMCKGLESCLHQGPSSVELQTLQRSGTLPLSFLRGVGLPNTLIDYLPSLLNTSIQLYSCFISYSTKDDDFAQRLYADLQDRGVRCWFAPHDMKIGARMLDTIDEAIQLRDKVLIVLSAASIASDWVEDEVTKAFAEERRRSSTVLFPVRLDDAVFTTSEAWALKLRDNRNIGDFRRWQEHAIYQKTLERLLRDLRIT